MPKAPPRISQAIKTRRERWQHKGRTTTERGYGWEHQKARKRLLQREPLCRECHKHGHVSAAVIADHIKPLAEGGSRGEGNLQPLCRPCSDAKTAAEGRRGAKKVGGRLRHDPSGP